MNKKITRESKFELMRIIAMLFIITWHIIIHGHVIENTSRESIKIILQIIQYIIMVHVSLFILITGYFQSKSNFKYKKFLKLLIITLFYSITIYLISIKIGWIKDYNKITIFNNMSLSGLRSYWFIAHYLILYTISDFINKFIKSINKAEYHKLLILLFTILCIIPFITGNRILHNDGYNFYYFIYLYLIGAYLRIYPIKESYIFKKINKNKYLIIMILVFILMAYLNFSIHYLTNHFKDLSSIFNEINSRISYTKLAYSSPFCLIQAISLFEIFNSLNIKSKLINYISKYVLSIYLIHDNIFVRENIYKIIKIDQPNNSYKIIILILVAAILIFIICLIIDIIRDKLFKLISIIYKKISKKKVRLN